MKHIIKTILSCYLLVLANGVFAQTFPIQLTPQSIPPQPIYLSDYANTNTTIDRLRLQVLLNDLTVPNLDVKLRIYVEGEGIMTRSNDLVIGAAPIILESGSPLQLGSIDLAPYFEFLNLQGINPNVYANALPEGIYNFCYEVYDVFTGIALSLKTCSTVVIFQNEPPFLNLPLDNSVIKQQDTYNILFQWTPRHINVSNTQYEFSLVQIFDNYVDPQAAFLSSQPIFQTQLSQTSLLYDLRFPPLLEGYRYAWRVRAFASNGAEEIGLFVNQGYSEIWNFTYTRPCNEVSSFTEESISRDRAKITWDGDPQHLDYTISYREKHAGSDWYIRKTPREYITIDALRPATTYEYKIAGNCEFGGFTSNAISEFTTLAEETPDNRYVCNIPPEKVDLSNQSLLDEIYVNDLFFANDFPITVLELTSSSPPFSGLGYIGIPWLNIARVGVEFKDIQINTDFKMVQGVVQTAYDPDWSNVEFIDQYLDFTDGDNDLDEETVPFVIATVEVADGEIIVTGVNGVVITYPTDDDTNVIDSDGTTYVITAGSEDIESVEPSEIGEGGRIDPANTDGFSGNGTLSQLSSEGIKVTFEDVSNAKYGFDKLPNVSGLPQSVLAQYEKTKDGSGANYYYIHKAVEKGITDKLKAKITTNDNTLLERLVFKTAQGILIPHDFNSNKTEATVTVKGLYNDEAETIYAAIVNPQDSTETIAGAFKLHHLPAAQTNDIKPVNVTVLTMNTVDTSDIHSAIKNQIKAIYKKAAVYNIQFAENENIKIDPSVWGGGDIEVGDSGPLAHYSADQRAIRDAIKESMTIDPKMYYLVVTDVPPNRLNYNGFMPLGGQFGFIFKNSNNSSDEAIAKVMAHELGHGAFGLKHQFPKENKEGLGTNWLMDYTPLKSDMNHMDWKQIHDPKWQTYLFQGDGDGASVYTNKYAFTPNMIPFLHFEDRKYLRPETIIKNGTVHGITENGKNYLWDSQLEEYTFNGEVYTIKKINPKQIKSTNLMYLFWYDENDCSIDKWYNLRWLDIKNQLDNLLINNITFLKINSGNLDCGGIPILNGKNRYDGRCAWANLEKIEEDRQILVTLFNQPLAQTEEFIEQVNDSEFCALRQIEYTLIEKALKKLVFPSAYSKRNQSAILKLMTAIPEENSNDFISFLSANDNQILVKLLKKLTNKNGYKPFMNVLGYLTSKLSLPNEELNKAEKWNVLNTIIKTKHSIRANEQSAFVEILTSIEGETNVPELVQLLADKIVLHTYGLDGFEKVYGIAKMHQENKELFPLFTHSKNDTWLDFSPSPKSSWLYPLSSLSGHLYGDPGNTWENFLANKYAWSKHLKENPILVKKITERKQDTVIDVFKNQLQIYLNETAEANNLFWSNKTVNSIACNTIGPILNQINTKENTKTLSEVDIKLRNKIFKTIFECKVSDSGSYNIDNVEDLVLKLVASYEPNEIPSIIKVIEEEVYLKNIFKELNNDNYQKFVMWLSSKISNEQTHKDFDYYTEFYNGEELKNPKTFLNLEANLLQRKNISGEFADGLPNHIRIDGGIAKKYDELVPIYIRGSFTFMGFQYKKGDVIIMPILQAFAMSESNRDKVQVQGAWLAFEVSFSIVTGYGGARILFTVGNSVRKAIIRAEVLGTSVGILADALNEDAITDKTRSRIQMFGYLTQGASLSLNIPKINRLVTKVDDNLNEIRRLNMSLSSRRTLVNHLEEIKIRLNSKTSYDLAWFDDLPDSFGTDEINDIKKWIEEGLDANKLENAFTNAIGKDSKETLWLDLSTAKGIHHRRLFIHNIEGIKGTTNGVFKSNSVTNMPDNTTKIIEGKVYDLRRSDSYSFESTANLPDRTDIEIIENFNNGIQLVKVKPGTKLYRVFDGYGKENSDPRGSFWSFKKPNSVEDVIGGLAVQPEWNGMTKIIEIEVPADGLIVWRGKAARQKLSNKMNINQPYLSGGDEQLILRIDHNEVNVEPYTISITDLPNE